MPEHFGLLRNDAVRIWQAGVAAVDSKALVTGNLLSDGYSVTVCGETFSFRDFDRVCVVGAGKAGAGMTLGVETVLAHRLEDRLFGIVIVPDDCVRPLKRIQLHGGRPAAHNEPTAAGVAGSRKILDTVQQLTERDLCLVLLSGGGSALLPAPVPQISLDDKQSVTKTLMQNGATIGELNCVRKKLSTIKGGGLARACRAGHIASLIISDVINDPLDVIASGPTVEDTTTVVEALEILANIDPHRRKIPQAVWNFLEQSSDEQAESFSHRVSNNVIGNNAVCLNAAGREAAACGYRVVSLGANNSGDAALYGQELLQRAYHEIENRADGESICLLSGGEPTVQLNSPRTTGNTSTPTPIGKGGRNQELVLSALAAAADDGRRLQNMAILSAGTDGEDGPTDAAGAIADSQLLESMLQQNLDPQPYLQQHNSYAFFQQVDGLLKTGLTHTNVMDLRVVVIDGKRNESTSTSPA